MSLISAVERSKIKMLINFRRSFNRKLLKAPIKLGLPLSLDVIREGAMTGEGNPLAGNPALVSSADLVTETRLIP